MKRLKFKKWVSNILVFFLALALFLLLTIEYENNVSEIIFASICLIIIFVNGSLLSIYG